MLLKRIAGTIFLAAMALPVAGQEFSTASELLQPAPKKAANVPRYAVAFGKVMARIDKSGTTKFNYEKGRLVSEVLPSSVIGTYQYDRAGRFHGIAYNDGKTITVAYGADGSISGLTSNTKARIKFDGKYKAAPNRLPLRGFLAIQSGVSTIQNNYCMGTDDDNSCTIIVQDSFPNPEDFGGWGGGGGGGYGWDPIEPDAGRGGTYPRTGTAYETPAECEQYVCESGREGFNKICAVVATPGADRVNCYSKSTEYYEKCVRSCESADWNWLNAFNFIWG
jgi:YD repeat-containing protein